MSTLFLSYARADLDTVDPLVHALQTSGLQVWRDQDSLYSGQRWPKAIGEAIAAQEGRAAGVVAAASAVTLGGIRVDHSPGPTKAAVAVSS